MEIAITCIGWGNDMSDRALKPDTIVNGRYRIDRVLGEGGFGITYLVHDIEDDKAYALKEYFPLQTAFRNADTGEVCVYEENNNKGKKRFREEAEILKEYRHLDGIVHVRDCFSFNETVYIVMEYIDGITLKEYVSLYGGFEYDEVMEMLTALTVPPTEEDLVTVNGNDDGEIRNLVKDADDGRQKKKGGIDKFVAGFAVVAIIIGVIYGITNSDRTVGETIVDEGKVSEEMSETSESKLCEKPDVVGMTNLEAYKKIREVDDKIHIETARQYSDEDVYCKG